MWRGLAPRFPDTVAAHIGFDEGLAHLIEGGADIFLMPSQFEPCGLNQMYSLRYGTVPLVRATGGLDDTVQKYDPYTGRRNASQFCEARRAAPCAGRCACPRTRRSGSACSERVCGWNCRGPARPGSMRGSTSRPWPP